MDQQRPRGREKRVTGPAQSVQRRGEGLGTGPAGSGRPQGGQSSGGGTRSGRNRSGGGFKMLILLAVLLLGGGGGLAGLLGGQSSSGPAQQQPQGSQSSINLSALLGQLGGGSVSSGWAEPANTGRLDTSVASGAREKYTRLLGNGRDTATVMVYMCGTDLESRAGMGTSDLQEMLAARFGENISLLVYTGGCKGWKNNQVSSSVNQIWQVKNGSLICLEKNRGAVSMTDPDVLSGYIRYCVKNFPASRYELILWDHGGGSVTGYGYDEKFASTGSMTLAGVDQALKDAGVKFDFIGFDACLMATAETALTLAPYADYLIASEETEPGVGWYYTDWLTDFGQDTSMPTIEVGRKIADTFVDTCAQKCQGQLTTLSVLDLAELEATLPAALADFSRSTSRLIQTQEYQTVSNARNGAREFAQSSKIDQVDLVHLARNLNTKEGDALANALLGAVKYNRTSSNMTNAYGVSIYFPYRSKDAAVNSAVKTYQAVGMDQDYIRCIRQFSQMTGYGQAASGVQDSPLAALLGGYSGGGGGAEAISQLLGGLLAGGTDRALDMEDEEVVQYLAGRHFNPENLVWTTGGDGAPVLRLGEDQWSLVQSLELNLFYDDGAGYLDMGLDNVFQFSDSGDLLGTCDNTWLALNGQPVAYYHTATVDDGTHYTITGYVPVLRNGQRAELLLTFDDSQPYGYVSGVRTVYPDGETETVAKSETALQQGDVLEFVCDYYGYDGSYQDSYLIGEPLAVGPEGLTIANVPLEGTVRATYRLTDLYNNSYWTQPIP